MADKTKPLVSIICLTYNQEDYLEQTLDSFLMQKTNFPFEVIIHDDASTDNTRKIIEKYDKANPGIFKPIYEKVNQYSKGDTSFINRMYESALGKYVTDCEGDDFWTDPLKLQLQVDFLESHQDYSIVFHPVRIFYEGSNRKDSIFPKDKDPKVFTLEELLKRNYIQSCSMMYRKPSYSGLEKNVMPMDWYTHLYHAQFGKIGFINRVMAAYRRHGNGIWWTENRDNFWKKHGLAQLDMYQSALNLYGKNPKLLQAIQIPINQAIDAISNLKFKGSDDDLLEKVIKQHPDMVEDFVLYKRAIAEKALVDHKNDVNKLNSVIDEQQQRIQKLEQTLTEITDSKAWKTVQKVRKLQIGIR
ncbi:MAG: glycosyltransferase [Candidatus Saccharibacteria bacterium]